jgi:hypothetical protein
MLSIDEAAMNGCHLECALLLDQLETQLSQHSLEQCLE